MRALSIASILALVCLTSGVSAQSVEFGDDSGAYVNDGECDDPRFAGGGMAASIGDESILKDATDCQALFQANRIRLVRTKAESSVTECKTIDFGKDTSQWANDGECDDPRFTGLQVDNILNAEDASADATDCKALCDAGEVWLR
jgi:hypothetical protein